MIRKWRNQNEIPTPNIEVEINKIDKENDENVANVAHQAALKKRMKAEARSDTNKILHR